MQTKKNNTQITPLDQAILNIVHREAAKEGLPVETFLGRALAAYKLEKEKSIMY